MFTERERSPHSSRVLPTRADADGLPGPMGRQFETLKARMRQASCPRIGAAPALDAQADALRADMSACLGDLDRLQAAVAQEVGRRRRLELDAFDARALRLRALA